MDTRLGIITGSMFAGVMLAGAVVADPGLAGPFSPGSIASAAGNVLHIGEREGAEHDEYEDEYEDEDEHEENDDDGDEHRQFSPAGAVDSRSAVRRHEEREHSRGPSSILVDTAGQGPLHEHEEDDD